MNDSKMKYSERFGQMGALKKASIEETDSCIILYKKGSTLCDLVQESELAINDPNPTSHRRVPVKIDYKSYKSSKTKYEPTSEKGHSYLKLNNSIMNLELLSEEMSDLNEQIANALQEKDDIKEKIQNYKSREELLALNEENLRNQEEILRLLSWEEKYYSEVHSVHREVSEMTGSNVDEHFKLRINEEIDSIYESYYSRSDMVMRLKARQSEEMTKGLEKLIQEKKRGKCEKEPTKPPRKLKLTDVRERVKLHMRAVQRDKEMSHRRKLLARSRTLSNLAKLRDGIETKKLTKQRKLKEKRLEAELKDELERRHEAALMSQGLNPFVLKIKKEFLAKEKKAAKAQREKEDSAARRLMEEMCAMERRAKLGEITRKKWDYYWKERAARMRRIPRVRSAKEPTSTTKAIEILSRDDEEKSGGEPEGSLSPPPSLGSIGEIEGKPRRILEFDTLVKGCESGGSLETLHLFSSSPSALSLERLSEREDESNTKVFSGGSEKKPEEEGEKGDEEER